MKQERNFEKLGIVKQQQQNICKRDAIDERKKKAIKGHAPCQTPPF